MLRMGEVGLRSLPEKRGHRLRASLQYEAFPKLHPGAGMLKKIVGMPGDTVKKIE